MATPAGHQCTMTLVWRGCSLKALGAREPAPSRCQRPLAAAASSAPRSPSQLGRVPHSYCWHPSHESVPRKALQAPGKSGPLTCHHLVRAPWMASICHRKPPQVPLTTSTNVGRFKNVNAERTPSGVHIKWQRTPVCTFKRSLNYKENGIHPQRKWAKYINRHR